MSIWLQIKYLKFIPLEGFVDKGNHRFNFRCPVCGDSQKSETKKRGWATEYKNNLYIKCFNCDFSSSFHKFLKIYFPLYYSDYIKEKYQTKNYTSKNNSNVDLFASEYDTLNLQTINDLPFNHKAKNYLRRRLIPENKYKKFYYSDNFALWLNNEIQKDIINYTSEKDRRIIIPFFDKYNKIFAFQGRGIDFQSPKYLTHKTDKNAPLIFGLDNINFTKKIFIVEGPFDSLFIDNCLALCGPLTDIDKLLMYTSKENIVVVPDNDYNNKYTDNFIWKIINNNYNIVIWPKDIKFKDINKGIENGLTKEHIYSIIEKNTFSGLKAITMFKTRRL